ncbi:MAG: tripartite tricarboxylate transporter TctB family protein [Desulfobacterales bacterium]|nr:tripartite tricarboxylate transporter TctB family protein [Desulfobacterales bacterium]
MKRDAITPLSLFLIAIIFIVYSLKYKFGSLNAPGVSFFPTVSATGLAGLSLFLFWKDRRSAKKERQSNVIHESTQEPIQRGKLCALFVVMVLFALLHSVLGFWLCIFGAMVAIQRIAGVSSWKWSFLGGGATMAIGYLVFERLMGAHFPEGVLEAVGYWLN